MDENNTQFVESSQEQDKIDLINYYDFRIELTNILEYAAHLYMIFSLKSCWTLGWVPVWQKTNIKNKWECFFY